MKPAPLKDIRQNLELLDKKELLQVCLRLAKFNKDNKHLLTYLLFEADDELAYVRAIKAEIDEGFENINTYSYYIIRKSSRKILQTTKTYIRFSQQKETEIELLVYFCQKMSKVEPSITNNAKLMNMYNTQIKSIKGKLSKMHEDIQFDYTEEIEELEKIND